ncbi:HD domain-containing protein [Nocardia beijingensis]|uniref:HD domain-containing phosphohydrolase n=1 Tax=Nocardia beijingensis TaxID=95162 RepID=UPI0018959447|nr:HD domain-containing phosphohydrolase [Nocardia beijingensis]MBF6466552.1 HD domain-containing protein [Nocardia beijingensis]
MSSIRAAEIFAALSLTTDLATGMPLEKGLATCLVATGLAERIGLPDAERRAVFHAALLADLGCTGRASENAQWYADDIAFQRACHVLDPGDPAVFTAQLRRFGSWAPAAQSALRNRFVAQSQTAPPQALRSSGEIVRTLGPRLGLPDAAVRALTEVEERWDGLGAPNRLRGEAISLPGRILHVAEQVVLALDTAGMEPATVRAPVAPRDSEPTGKAAEHGRARPAVGLMARRPEVVEELRRRAGGHLDPDLVAVCDADAIHAMLDVPDLLAAVLAAEPGTPSTLPAAELERPGLAMAMVVDLKGRYLLGHSAHVAGLADAAAAGMGLPADDRAALRAAALLHDLGRAAVSSAVWDRGGPLGPQDWKRVRLRGYWTERILRRCPGLADLADLAAAHHERLDGSGHPRGRRDTSPGARLLAAADVFAACTEARPYRPAARLAEAAAHLGAEVAAGRLDGAACAAVIAAAEDRTGPAGHDLSEIEIAVLRRSARGHCGREIAAALLLPERTVAHHLSELRAKTGHHTRAGAAVFAMSHRLLPG